MSRSSTTGIYTRVDNSFSNPVVGTTISPTDADTFFDDIEACMNSFIGTSTSSLLIGMGSKVFTTQSGKTFIPGTYVQAISQASAANYMFGTVTSYSGTTLTLNITDIGGSGTLADWSLFMAGGRGGPGPIAGFRQTYSSTTADADPGAGVFRLNNATPASATAAYLDNLDTFGNTVSAIIDKWDDHTSTVRGLLRIEKEHDASVWAEFNVTGSVVDGTGYRKLTLTAGSGSGAFTASDAFRISFIPKGDKGTDGTGIFPGSSTDKAVVRFNGTGGGTVQDSIISISDTGALAPVTNDTGALGTTSLKWSDLFLADGAVINFNNGNATLTHSTGLLTSSVALSLGVSNAFTAGSFELGHASDTTFTRVSAGVAAIEGVNILTTGTGAKLAGSQTLTGGFRGTSFDNGTVSSGTLTPDANNSNIQQYTNNGAHTLAPPANTCSIVLDQTNGASAGTVTRSGFTKTSGDSLTTTNGNKFRHFISVGNAGSHCHTQAMQ